MASATIIVTAVFAVFGLGLFLNLAEAHPRPDGAGYVEMVNGLAYGGIPYGSVSGNLANTIPAQRSVYYGYNNGLQQASASVLVPVRTAGPSVLKIVNPVSY